LSEEGSFCHDCANVIEPGDYSQKRFYLIFRKVLLEHDWAMKPTLVNTTGRMQNEFASYRR
jgi:hypothetical protein